MFGQRSIASIFAASLAAVATLSMMAMAVPGGHAIAPGGSDAYPATDCLIGLGFVTSCREMTPEDAYSKIAAAADIAYIQRTWPEWSSNLKVTQDEIDLARRQGLKIYIAFDGLSYDDVRGHLILPKGISGDFRTPAVRDAYLALMTSLAKKYKPDYFVPMVEINLHSGHDKADYDAYKAFYPTVYKAIKSASASTIVAPSITYSDYDGRNGIDENDRKTFARLVSDFDEYSDMLAVSLYPLWTLNPHNIPQQIFCDMSEASRKPLFIAETSWPSESFNIPVNGHDFLFETSEPTQAFFVERLHECVRYMQSQKHSILAINFVSLADPNGFIKMMANVTHSQFNWFGSLAFADSKGHGKPAYSAMSEWKHHR